MNVNIGFMQGRLTDIVDNKIQSFPWSNWRNEFNLAKKHDFNLMEWTLDYDNLRENPLMTKVGQREIQNLSKKYDIKIFSLTGDCFMQNPFWKSAENQFNLENEFMLVTKACSRLGIKIIVVPLVDEGSVENEIQEKKILDFFLSKVNFFKKNNVRIAFETDFDPHRTLKFINFFDDKSFGINYDIGNSASLGFDPKDEIMLFGKRIFNVHIKDRLFNGSTVPLGNGCADFVEVFKNLNIINYKGNFILQGARSNNKHGEVLELYRSKVLSWMEELRDARKF